MASHSFWKRDGKRGLLAGVAATVLIFTAVLVLLVPMALATSSGFPDVPESNPYFDAISELASRGVIGGYADGRFGPDDAVTRQQFAKLIVLTGAYPVSEADACPFLDVSNSGTVSLFPDNYVAVCAARGITTGKTATVFDPYSSITRLQVVSMVVRAAQDLRSDLLTLPASGWLGSAAWAGDPTHGANAALAEYNGLLEGLDLTGDPTGAMTRGEVAQVLFNLIGTLAEPQGSKTATLTLAVAGGNGAFTVTPDKVVYSKGESVTITAIPAAGYAFAGWGGAGLGDADPFTNPLTVVMEADKSLTVSFALPTTVFEDLGGPITSAPAVCSRSYGLMDVFARGVGGTLIHRTSDGLAWSGWEELGGAIKAGSDPVAVSWGPDRLDVFAQGDDDAVWHLSWDGSQWSQWESLGGSLISGPAAAYREAGGGAEYLDVFVIDVKGRLVQSTFDGTAWGEWREISLSPRTPKAGSALAAVTWGRRRIDLFVSGAAGELWRAYLPPGGDWATWQSLQGAMTSNYSACTSGSWAEGQLDLFARGADNGLWHRSVVSGLWSAWHSMRLGPVASAPAAVYSTPERVDVFVRGLDSALWHKSWTDHSWEF